MPLRLCHADRALRGAQAERWLQAAPRLAAGFRGKRLPDTPAELAREIARLDGAVSSKREAERTADSGDAEARVEATRGRGVAGMILLSAGLVLLAAVAWQLQAGSKY
jgi:hypothetical protein